VNFKFLAKPAKLGKRLSDVANEAEVCARRANDAIGEESALRVICREEDIWPGSTLDTKPDLPGQVGSVIDG
jgi:hypothetical protein